jgi:hypothetical protein
MKRKALILLAGIGTGLIGFNLFNRSKSILVGLTVIFFTALLIYRMRSYQVVWDSLSLLQHPAVILLIFFASAYYFFPFEGYSFLPSSSFAIGLALIGFAVGTVIHAYWNIA